MMYRVGNLYLETVQEVLHGSTNDVKICRDINQSVPTYYTLLLVGDHEIVKEILKTLKQDSCKELIRTFTWEDEFCLLFEYKPLRRLDSFYMAGTMPIQICEKICINLIMECISSELPYPFLYLILDQMQIHMEKDNSVYFGYELDLSGYDSSIDEKKCALKCASILIHLLEEFHDESIISYSLLERKLARRSYGTFTALYKDVRMAAVPLHKPGIRKRILAFFKRNKGRFIRIFMTACVILGVIAFFMLITQLIFGDVPFMRLFFNPFQQIGTERLS